MSSLEYHEPILSDLAPAGFYIGLRVGFSFPSEELNCLPSSWVDHYTLHGYVVHDPMMKWVYGNQGVMRISSLQIPDPTGVLAAAAGFGLRYGAVASIMAQGEHGRRSYGQFLRSDREYTAGELATLHDILRVLHGDSGLRRALTAAEIEALKLQSTGLRLKQIAAELDISISAVKARLASAKRKLGAQTPSQAAKIATTRGIL